MSLWQDEYAELDAALLSAHSSSDTVSLVQLYQLGADAAEKHADLDAACFFLTQALVFALEGDLDEYDALAERLHKFGRL